MRKLVQLKLGEQIPNDAKFISKERVICDDQDDPTGPASVAYETVYVYEIPINNIAASPDPYDQETW